MLYDASAHEPLVGAPWGEHRVRAAIRAIAAEAEASCRGDDLWPADEWDAWSSEPPLSNLYVGAAGVVWALAVLRDRGLVDVRLDLAGLAHRALERFAEHPDYADWPIAPPATAAASLFLGESGILLVAHRLDPKPSLAERLRARIRENLGNTATGLFWGAPGTLLAALEIEDADGARSSVESIVEQRDADGLWTQELYGEPARSTGVAHGFAGIAHALARAGATLTDASQVAERIAVAEDGLANWPHRAGGPLRAEDGELRLQWDIGGAGVVASLGNVIDEPLAVGGGELVWRAGPLRKGPMLCHGTAGNGLALLRLFERTGDERWLARARRFAMHALAQVEAVPPRYSLWTGGIGVALYLARCLDGDASVPVLDTLDR